MADTCSDVSARLAALEAAVAAIPRVNEASILAKATQQAKSLIQELTPGIAGAVAIGFVAPVKTQVAEALGIATEAEAAAGSALGQIGGLIGKVAGLAASIAAILGTIATLQVLGGRIDSIENRLDSFDNSLSSIYGLITTVKSIAQNALNRATDASKQAFSAQNSANNAQNTANNASNVANNANSQANRANSRLDALDPKIAFLGSGLIDAEERLSLLESEYTGLKLDVENIGDGVISAKNLARNAQSTANNALSAANNASTKADNSLNVALNADSNATKAIGDAVNAQSTATTAKNTATAAQGTATAAKQKVDALNSVLAGIGAIANSALGISSATAAELPKVKSTATTANNTANQALNVADGLSKINNGVVTSPGGAIAQIIPIGNDVKAITVTTTNLSQQQQQINKQLQQQQKQIQQLQQQQQQNQMPLTQQQQQQLSNTALAVAALTPIIQQIGNQVGGIAQNTTPSSLANAAATGVCKSTAPGGCMNKALQQNASDLYNKLDNKFQNLTNAINSGLSGAILTTVNRIDQKMGAFVPGGLSGVLGNFYKAFQTFQSWEVGNKIYDYLQLILTMQMSFMLIEGLGTITSQTINNALAVFGFKDPTGQPIDVVGKLGNQIGQSIDNLFGNSVSEAFQLELKTANKIFNSAANVANMVQGCFWSVFNAFNVIGSWNAQIGNALKKYGVVGHAAFPWMNPTPNFHNKVFTLLFNANNVLAQVNMVAQTIIQGRQQIEQTADQFTALENDLANTVGTAVPEFVKAAQQYAQSQQASVAPTPTPDILAGISQSF